MAAFPNDVGLLTRRLDFSAPGGLTIHTGKVELGQGILTALVNLASVTLDLDPVRILVPPPSTRTSPDEGYTASSLSVQTTGAGVQQACVQARALLTEACARELGVVAERLAVRDGGFLLDGAATRHGYWDFAAALEGVLAVAPDADLPLVAPRVEARRVDLARKVSGAAFLHDFTLPGMIHGRVVRPPSMGSRLEAAGTIDDPALSILRDGDFLAVVGREEAPVVVGARMLAATSRWRPDPAPDRAIDLRVDLPAGAAISEEVTVGDGAPAPGRRLSASFTRPGVAHGSIAPSCAVALYADGALSVWSHSQNIFFLRDALAAALDLPSSAVAVTHLQSAGCYGHNGADDVAFDAARLALACEGRPVRVQWSRADELRWAPVGAPGLVRIEADLGEDGTVGDWRFELWTAPHGRRPTPGAPNLLGAATLEQPIPLSPPQTAPMPTGGGERNAVALYAFPRQVVRRHFVTDFPVRTSSLRSLGAHLNIFAIESFMDQLAEAADADPVAFRLSHLADPRARAAIERVAGMAGWADARERRDGGSARGLGFARYKNTGGYAAVVVEAEVDRTVAVTRVWCAADVGSVASADGVRNQIEGGIIQSLSWALKEDAKLRTSGVGVANWDDYPILTFSETPQIDVALMDCPDQPPLGAGEIVQGPATAAVANAVARAVGARIFDLPITRERIVTAIAGA